MKWKYRSEDWTYIIGLSEDGDSLSGSDKPGGFGPKPGFQRGIKWLQQESPTFVPSRNVPRAVETRP